MEVLLAGPTQCFFCLTCLTVRTSFNMWKEEIEQFFGAAEDLPKDYNDEFKVFAETLMARNNVAAPTNPKEALELYMFLLSKIEEYSSLNDCIYFNPSPPFEKLPGFPGYLPL